VENERKIDRADMDVMGVVGDYFEHVIVVEGEFEVWRLMVISEIVVGGSGDDVCVDVGGVNDRGRKRYSVEVGIENAALGVEGAYEFLKLGVVEVSWSVGENWCGETKKVVLAHGYGCLGWEDSGVAVELFREK
jgi:hypothetical protein